MVTATSSTDGKRKETESWAEWLRSLRKNQVLLIDLADASDDEEREVRQALELGDSGCSGLAIRREAPSNNRFSSRRVLRKKTAHARP
jgi:hypothetical protein